ncbi:unnamed protein product [Cercospora beticola]|nr:unnamed protein product [Cercospora beticola]
MDDEKALAAVKQNAVGLVDIEKTPACVATQEVEGDALPEDEHPRNWTLRRKWLAVGISSLLTTIPPVASSIVAPALERIRNDLNITNKAVEFLVLSSWQLTFNCGPFILGPLSETFGRVAVLQGGMLWFLVFNLVCGLSRDTGTMIACRFLAGFGGGSGTGFGVVTDLFEAHERGNAVALYNIGPTLSPAIGPVFSAFVVEYSTWRWSFHAITIWTGVVLLGSVFFLQETRESVLKSWKSLDIQDPQNFQMPSPMHRKSAAKLARFQSQLVQAAKKTPNALLRPFQMLGKEPAVQALALLNAYFYGIMMLAVAIFPTLYVPVYGQTISIAGLHYMSLALGYLGGGYLCKFGMDKTYNHLRRRLGGPDQTGRPEFRIPLMIIGSISVPVGLFLFGWSAQNTWHWIVPDTGAFVFSAGIMISIQSATNYMVDAYTEFSASAIGATWFLRGIAGFTLPIVSPYLYQHLDLGWGTSLLAFIAMAVGLPAPLLLWKYGEMLRSRSNFSNI